MPNNEEHVAILKDRRGRQVALKSVKVDARLHGLMAEVEVEQSYVNPQKTNIEAVYTFPLPLGAVLLGLDVEIAGKKLSGSVVERKMAERSYEDAVTDGDSAVMLQEAGPGLYTASIGNLMANESAVIRYRYGLMLSWQGQKLRFLLPTTIAPRYGDAIAAGLQPHQIPEAALDVEYPLDLSIAIVGELASSRVSSPSHSITVGRSENGVVVNLSKAAVLDRDFVLNLESETTQSTCVDTPDKDKHVAVASLRIPPVNDQENKPLNLKIVIDCSGSMEGISIAQARKAALEILNTLSPQDKFNVTLFGSSFQHFFRNMVPASARYITEAWNHLDKLDADLGGTEMGKALDAAFSLGNADEESNLLLITDGEIHEHAKLVKRAQKSGHRVFVVGVGTAVAETFLRSLAATTGGACELVAPQEGMSEHVLNQFHRMRQPRLGTLSIEWPAQPDWMTPLPETVFAGDTVHVFAGFGMPICGSVSLKTQNTSLVAADISESIEVEMPRMAASRRMEYASEDEGLRLALEYQLLSRWTNYLVIAERAEKATDLPELHQVPQMLAAGWGGTGALVSCSRTRLASYSMDLGDMPPVFQSGRSSARNASVDEMRCSGVDKYDIPAFLRKCCDDDYVNYDASGHELPRPSPARPIDGEPVRFVAAMTTSMAMFLRQPRLPKTIKELEKFGLDQAIASNLRDLVAQGHDEAEVVAAFIYALSESAIGDRFGRSFKRAILKAWKQTVPWRDIDFAMTESLSAVSAEAWNWTPLHLEVQESACIG